MIFNMKQHVAPKPLAAAALCALLPLAGAHAADSTPAADWPERAVRIVVPYATGASTDVMTRRMAQALSDELGQSFFVENRTGAMGTIGTNLVVREKPDGYTLVANDTTNVMLPHVMKNVPYDSERDLKPIAGFMFSPLGIVVANDGPYKTLEDLVEAAKAKPGRLTYGSGGAGSSPHLATEQFAAAAGIKLMHIPYRGAGEAVLAVMGKQLDMQFVSPTTALGNVKGGKLRMLAISGEERQPLLPDVPTFKEAGLPEFSVFNWIGLWAPRDTPEAVADKLRGAIRAVMESPEIVAYAREWGASPRYIGGDDFAAFLSQERDKWGAVTQRIGLEKQ